AQTRASDIDTLAVNDFSIQVQTRPDLPLSLGGSTPCVDDDATRIAKETYGRVAVGGALGAPLFLALAVLVVDHRIRLRLGLDTANRLRIMGLVGFAVSLACLAYGVGGLAWMSFNENTF